LITHITDIVVEKTIKQKIPTVVFLSHIDKGSLVKNIIWSIKDGNKNENTFTSDDWEKIAKIMQNLAEIPLLLKVTSDINDIQKETENFINEMNKRTGIVIIDSDNIQTKDFTTKKNISIIVVGVNGN
jgi:replicative DNA helicase